MSGFPETLPGHWDTAEGRDIAADYLTKPREWLGKAELSDFALANAQYLEDISVGTVTFQSAIAMQTAAKERIRWLSARLAVAELQLAAERRRGDTVPGRLKCQKCGFGLSKITLFMGDGTAGANDEPDVCPNDGSPLWRVSYREAWEELTSQANSEIFASMAIINQLREPEGASVTILCDNPDFNGQPDRNIEVIDDWTGWEPRRFGAAILFQALCDAQDARIAAREAEGTGA